ncbi:MAG: hypothetical protein IIW01_04600 [Thermoguttaceae bacterium]|nr:hypothetical protein [Thermoguttaceae bacterium]
MTPGDSFVILRAVPKLPTKPIVPVATFAAVETVAPFSRVVPLAAVETVAPVASVEAVAPFLPKNRVVFVDFTHYKRHLCRLCNCRREYSW